MKHQHIYVYVHIIPNSGISQFHNFNLLYITFFVRLYRLMQLYYEYKFVLIMN